MGWYRNKPVIISFVIGILISLVVGLGEESDNGTMALTAEFEEPDQNRTITANEFSPLESYGIQLDYNYSVACGEIHMNYDHEYICFYLQVRNETSNMDQLNTVLELHFKSDIFELTYGLGGYFVVFINRKKFVFKVQLVFDEWTYLCVLFTFNIDEFVFGIYNQFVEALSDEEILTDKILTANLANFRNHSSDWDSLNIKSLLCVGTSNEKKNSLVGSVAAIKQFLWLPFKLFLDCLTLNFIGNDIMSPELLNGAVKTKKYNLRDLCWSTYQPLWLDEPLDFYKQFSRCKNLRGQMITSDLITSDLKTTYGDTIKDNFIKKSSLDINPANGNLTWVSDGEYTRSKKDLYCPSFNFKTMKLLKIPCKTELKFNFCLLPKDLNFFLYGTTLSEYDRLYSIRTKNGSWFLEGNDSSFLDRKYGNWTLQSKYHDKELILQGRAHPIGRNIWKSHDGLNEYLLTITNCGKDKFACSDNYCVSKSFRCDDDVDCRDKSDEEKCSKFQMELGEKTIEKAPRLIRLSIEYSVTLFSILSISPRDGIAEADLGILLAWNDKRITYILHHKLELLNCTEIWLLTVYASDILDNYLKYEIVSTKCYSKNNVTGPISANDPYMGSKTTRKNVKIFYYIRMRISIPCHFGFKKYPFGVETFSMKFSHFSSDGGVASGTDNYKLKFMEDKGYDQIGYYGIMEPGEFKFMEATHGLANDSKLVMINISFQTLYGYHVVNSFAPSFLICLIAYCTLFFPITDFNERIMVSLTSLLVLAALMTQSSNQSSRTSNINYLDIWYLSLVSFCFLLVFANLLMHKINIRRKEKLDNSVLGLNKINICFKIVFAIFFASFVTIFVLAAADIIFVEDLANIIAHNRLRRISSTQVKVKAPL